MSSAGCAGDSDNCGADWRTRRRKFAAARAEAGAVGDAESSIAGMPPVPRKPAVPVSRLLAAFMEEKNIRWGELVGGLLIVGCSIALVISFWSEIAARPLLEVRAVQWRDRGAVWRGTLHRSAVEDSHDQPRRADDRHAAGAAQFSGDRGIHAGFAADRSVVAGRRGSVARYVLAVGVPGGADSCSHQPSPDPSPTVRDREGAQVLTLRCWPSA